VKLAWFSIYNNASQTPRRPITSPCPLCCDFTSSVLHTLSGPVIPLGAIFMRNICVFTASKFEARPILELGTAYTDQGRRSPGVPLSIGSNSVTVVVAGMGPKNAKASAIRSLGLGTGRSGSSFDGSIEKPDFVLVTGLCGGLTPLIRETQVVVYHSCLSMEGDGRLSRCSEPINHRIRELLSAAGTTCDPVLGMTANRIATSKTDRTALARSGATVVDMETYEILAVSAAAQIPAAVLRVVSDSFDRELPDFNAALNTHGTLDGRRALWVALGSPVRTLRLLEANKRAVRQLAHALGAVLTADWGACSRSDERLP
jgi:hypothetical protein